jgi:hypothetical protein
MIQSIKTIIAISLFLFLFKSADALWPSELVKHSNAQFIDSNNTFTVFATRNRKVISKERMASRKDTINHIVYLPVYIPIPIVSYYPVYIPISIANSSARP